ncbi:MAG: hypothetical protein IKP72_03490, partial [Clostridia bacterium]|nr:hypothetical protein [Clostridia bacterium]
MRLGRTSWISIFMSLSGTAAFGRQAGCFASGENTGKWPGEKPQSNMLIYASLVDKRPFSRPFSC